jgi:hypothetical protein
MGIEDLRVSSFDKITGAVPHGEADNTGGSEIVVMDDDELAKAVAE